MIQGISRNGAILGGFTLATTILIALTHWVTAPVIEQQVQNKAQSTIRAVLPQQYWDNDITQNCVFMSQPEQSAQYKVYRGYLQGEPSGVVLEAVTPQGYSGNIKYLVSLIDNTTIGGVRVLEHKETPGLGDKIELRISDWILNFEQLPANQTQREDWAVKKDGGKFDQFTGATITPRAIVNGVKHTISWAQDNYQAIFAMDNQCEPQNKESAND